MASESTVSSAWPQESASSITSASELDSSGARISPSKPFHNVHHSNTQSSSDLSVSSPNILQAISEDIIRHYPSSTRGYNAIFTVRWELGQYLKTELDELLDPVENMLESVLTITGTGSAAYATTARSYMQQEWPDSLAYLLGHLEDWVLNGGSGKSRQLKDVLLCNALAFFYSTFFERRH